MFFAWVFWEKDGLRKHPPAPSRAARRANVTCPLGDSRWPPAQTQHQAGKKGRCARGCESFGLNQKSAQDDCQGRRLAQCDRQLGINWTWWWP
ncbi:hypothetical protein KL939_003705 [Ogataea angusta]|nr:hypothetical protein KL939_003705 [Ogataea angusta]